MNPDQLREAIAYLDACLLELHQDGDNLRTLTPEDQTRFDEGLALRETYRADLARHEQISTLASVPARTEPGDQRTVNVNARRDPLEVMEDRTSTPSQLADAATRCVEDRYGDDAYTGQARSIFRRHATDREWVRSMIARSSDDYASAWCKFMTGRENLLTPDEQRAALSVGSNTNGGYLVPTHLDPTIILTNAGTSNAIRGLSRVVTLDQSQGNIWNGVTSAGSTASWDGELVEVSDDSPTFGRASIPTYMAQEFVQASLASFEDIAGLTSDVMMILADARDRLEGAAHATGSGSSQPTGVFTAIAAVTASRVVSTTAATIGLVDLEALYTGIPVRWRNRSSFLMNPVYAMSVKNLGTALSASYSTDITQAPTGVLLGRTVTESDDAPTTQTTTALDPEILLADFSTYVIVDKPGSFAVEYIPNLFNVANNLPDGRRGWFGHWRNGANSTTPAAARLLVDKTTA